MFILRYIYVKIILILFNRVCVLNTQFYNTSEIQIGKTKKKSVKYHGCIMKRMQTIFHIPRVPEKRFIKLNRKIQSRIKRFNILDLIVLSTNLNSFSILFINFSLTISIYTLVYRAILVSCYGIFSLQVVQKNVSVENTNINTIYDGLEFVYFFTTFFNFWNSKAMPYFFMSRVELFFKIISVVKKHFFTENSTIESSWKCKWKHT